MLSLRHPFKTFRIMAQKIVAQFLVLLDGFKTTIVSKDSLCNAVLIFSGNMACRSLSPLPSRMMISPEPKSMSLTRNRKHSIKRMPGRTLRHR